MDRLLTKSEKSLDCYSVMNGPVSNLLMIYSNKLSPKEAYTFFGDSEDISELTIDTYSDITGEKQMTRIMRKYIVIESIQKPLEIKDDKMLLIVLSRPKDDEVS